MSLGHDPGIGRADHASDPWKLRMLRACTDWARCRELRLAPEDDDQAVHLVPNARYNCAQCVMLLLARTTSITLRSLRNEPPDHAFATASNSIPSSKLAQR